MSPKLILTGFMGTGKSVVGHRIAKRLGWRFVDSDAEVVAVAGRAIAEIFAERGESEFRRLEREAIARIAAEHQRCAQCGEPRPAVVATGGGALVEAANSAALKRSGVIVCLSARPDVIAARIGRSASKRPMLTEGGKPLDQRLRELLAERAEAYARADVSVDTSDLTIDEAVERVLDAFRQTVVKRWAHSA